MPAEIPQTLEYRSGQLNIAPVLKVENFINCKKDIHVPHNNTPDYIYPIIVRSDFDVEDGFSSTNTPGTITQLPDYPSSFTGKPPLLTLDDLFLQIRHDDEIVLARVRTSTPEILIEDIQVKVLMALAEDNDAVSKDGAKNGKWVKISMRKVHTLLEMEDNDDRKNYLEYLSIHLNYIEEQRNNLMSKHRDLVQKLNICKEQLSVLKQAKLEFYTMQHVNTEILKENKNLRIEQKELTKITKTWLNSSNKVNQCISEQIPIQKNILGVDQLTDDLSSSGQKLKTDYDSVDESSVCNTPLLLLKKLDGVEPVSRPKTVKSILKSISTFKAKALKGVIINKPTSAPAKGNKSTSASKVNSTPAGKLKMTFLWLLLCGSYDHETNGHNRIISFEIEIKPRNLQHVIKRCETHGSTIHNITDHYDIELFKRGEALQAKNADALKLKKTGSSKANRSKTPTRGWVSRKN
ncbi:hypothetical protein Tco_0615230 [Tanacetum coccineum]